MNQISAYLQLLDRALRLPRRLRVRVLREVADHLGEARVALVAEGVEEAEAERRVITDFGEAHELARSFGAQVAATAGRRATLSATCALLGFLALFGGLSALPARSLDEMVGFPSAAVLFVLAQVALVAGVLSAVRVVRHPRFAPIDADQLRYVMRGNAVALGCIGLAASIGVAATAGHLHPTAVASDGVATAGLLAVAALTGWASARTLRSAAVLDSAPTGPRRGELALDDLQAAATRLRTVLEARAGRAAAWLAIAERGALGAVALLRRRAPFLLGWLDLRRHPWRFCVTVAAFVGCLIAIQHGLADGGLSARPSVTAVARMLAGGLILASIEATFVVAGFALLGGWLGIRPAVGRQRTPR